MTNAYGKLWYQIYLPEILIATLLLCIGVLLYILVQIGIWLDEHPAVVGLMIVMAALFTVLMIVAANQSKQEG